MHVIHEKYMFFVDICICQTSVQIHIGKNGDVHNPTLYWTTKVLSISNKEINMNVKTYKDYYTPVIIGLTIQNMNHFACVRPRGISEILHQTCHQQRAPPW